MLGKAHLYRMFFSYLRYTIAVGHVCNHIGNVRQQRIQTIDPAERAIATAHKSTWAGFPSKLQPKFAPVKSYGVKTIK